MKKIMTKFKSISIAIISIFLLTLNSCISTIEDYDELEVDPQLEKQYKIISKEDIPEGIKPIILKDKTELYELIRKINTIELHTTFDQNERTGIRSMLKDRSEGSGIKSITADVFNDFSGSYTILIQLSYNSAGSGDITVTSTEANTWYFSSWTQTAGAASWIGKSSLEYHVAGDIKWYAMIGVDFIEIRRINQRVDGTEQI